MSISEFIPNDWNDLQRLLFESSWNDVLHRHRSPFAFRGLSKKTHKLATSLTRLGGDYCKLERHLLRNFKKYAHRDVVERDSDWHWLSVAQHHGLPTRLLDWTYSPYVALHFATSHLTSQNESDGVIWAVNYVQCSDFLPRKLREGLHKEDANGFSVDMLVRMQTDPFTVHEQADNDFVLFFEPPSMDDRIVNQFALFSMMSNPQVALDDWLGQHEHVAKKIILPANLMWEIRDKLDQANITERVLFPGLDGLSDWLKRHYSSRTNHG